MPTTTTSQGSFTITIRIGSDTDGTDVTLRASDFQDPTAGYTFELPEDSVVQLGGIANAIEWINDQLPAGVPNIPDFSDTSSWPPGIKQVADAAASLDVSIDTFRIVQDPKGTAAEYPPLKVDVHFSADFNPTVELISGALAVRGFGVAYTRSYTET